MEATSRILYAVQARIRSKLVAIGAISRETAAKAQQAHFSVKQINWIDYIAGGMFATIKKTGDGRFYVPVID